MKITNLYVSNFLGAVALDLPTPEPIQLFAGANGAGKSSVRDAVALALTADLGRVSLKKEVPALIHDGAEAAVCELQDADGDTFRVTLTAGGKITDSRKGRDNDPALQYVLDGQRFARLEDKERRGFLFGLMDLKTDGAAIVKRLVAKGADKAKVDRLAPLLRSGFPAACTEAKAKATEAKGAWRQITGETYGSEKAKTWAAPVPKHDAAGLAAVAMELQHCDVAIESWQTALGKVQAQEQRRAGLRAKLPALQAEVEKYQRVDAKLVTDRAGLAEWEQKLAATKAEAGGGARVGLVHELGWALNNLLFYGDPLSDDDEHAPRIKAAMAAYEAEHGKVGTAGDPEAQARLPEVQRSRDLMASAVTNGERDLAAIKKAQADAEAIEEELAAEFDASAGDEAVRQLATLKATRTELVAKRDAHHGAKAQTDAAEKKTKDAAAAHHDVAAWDLLGDALSPDGIPGEILSEALEPLNERLSQSATDTGWPLVRVHSDMAIVFGGREYRLLSESEKWRADAMLAEAISFLSSARLLVLDRFDVLDLPGRSQLFAWLGAIAEAGEIDTALVFGTLKAAPTTLPSNIGVHWIERGHVGQPLKAAA